MYFLVANDEGIAYNLVLMDIDNLLRTYGIYLAAVRLLSVQLTYPHEQSTNSENIVQTLNKMINR